MTGFGIGFGSQATSRQFAALGQNLLVTTLQPSSAWNGTAGSGFAGSPPVDPIRISAKPACRLFTPPNQYFTDELVVGVWAGANHSGTMLDNLGLEKVIAHCEGESFEITAPSFYLHEDANGNARRYLGWWVVLQHPGSHGHMDVYFEAVPKDPTMQNRIVGPFQYSPQPAKHDYNLEVAPSQSEIAGSRYQSLKEALNYLTAQSADNPLITISESFTADLESANLYAGGEGHCTITATAPVTFRKPGFSTGAAALFRPRVDGLWFKGENITFDFYQAANIYHESSSNREHVFEGVQFLDSGGRYYTYLGGQKPTLYISRDNPYFLECSISNIQDPCNNANLVRGCNIQNGNRDAASGAKCVIGNSIFGWTSDEWRAEIDALSVQYTGSAGTASLQLSGGNESNGRVLTARVDLVDIASFTINNSEADHAANSNYTVQNVVDWLNSLADWSATLVDSSRRASALSIVANSGAAFPATDTKSAPLTLVTMIDQHSDIWALNANSDSNVIFADNLCYQNALQSLYIGPPSGLSDCMVFNNTFHLDEQSPDSAVFVSQLTGQSSHVVVAHNSWANQLLVLRSDMNYDPDGYCLVANNVMPQLAWGGAVDGDLVIADNHLFAGASIPAGASGTTIGGDEEELFFDPSTGSFIPTGALLNNLKTPVVRYDRAGMARGIPAAAGASAGGAEIAPQITSANPSGTYVEGDPILGRLTANKPVTWSVIGNDAGSLTLQSGSGDWALETTDFETKTAYDLTFVALDSAGDSHEQIVAIAVSDVDEIAPALSAVSSVADGANSATLSVTSDEGTGTLYWYLSQSVTPPSATDLIAGTASLASGSQGVIFSGVQNVTVNGLAAGTAYFAHFLQSDGASHDSAVISGTGFTTQAGASAGVVVESFATVLNTSSGQSSYDGAPFSYSGASGNVLIAVVSLAQGGTPSINDLLASVDGASMTPINGAGHSGGGARPMTGVFVASGLSGGSKNVQINHTVGFRSCSILLMEVSGLDASNLLANSIVLEGSGGSYNHGYSPTASGNLIIASLATKSGNQNPFSPDAGVIELEDLSTGGTAVNDHSSFVGYTLSTSTNAIDVGAAPSGSSNLLFTVTELQAT